MKHLIIIIFLAINFSSCRENDEVTGTGNDGGGSGSSGGSSSGGSSSGGSSSGGSSSGSTGAIVGHCTVGSSYKILYRNPGSVSDSTYRDQLETACISLGVWSDTTSVSCSGTVCLDSALHACTCYDFTGIDCSISGAADVSDCSGL